MAFRPIFNQVVVRPTEVVEATPAGVVLPERLQPYADRGVVVSTGKGHRNPKTGEMIPLDVQVGDTVLYSRFAGEEHTLDGQQVRLLPEEHILAVLEA